MRIMRGNIPNSVEFSVTSCLGDDWAIEVIRDGDYIGWVQSFDLELELAFYTEQFSSAWTAPESRVRHVAESLQRIYDALPLE